MPTAVERSIVLFISFFQILWVFALVNLYFMYFGYADMRICGEEYAAQ